MTRKHQLFKTKGVFKDAPVLLFDSFRKLLLSICTNMSSKNVVFKKICKDKSVSEAPQMK